MTRTKKSAPKWKRQKQKKERTEGDYLVEKKSEIMEKYYKEQQILPVEEWQQFMQTITEPLPCAFRISLNRKENEAIKRILEEKFFSHLNCEVDGTLIRPPQPLLFYPNQLAWQYEASRKQMKTVPTLSDFWSYLNAENEVGNVTRQEAVSMIPPLLLDVQPQHFALDMCAAPGSKTSQLLEFMMRADKSDGVVVANDADQKRCYTLVHQSNRLQSPNILVTNYDAAHFPNLYRQEGEIKVKVEFDRILADVPCSGDGTIRKNVNIWRSWKAQIGLGLHPLQVQILKRAIQLLKDGGRVVYSTCSMNPVENEAVVAEILRHYGDSVELLDVSAELPDLKRRPGLKQWKVMDKNENFHDTYNLDFGLKASLFPPKENENFPLERCLRVYPHLQNTGAFFVAVLQKKTSTETVEQLVKKQKFSGLKEAPFNFLNSQHPLIQELSQEFNLNPNFPLDQFLNRSEKENGVSKTVYYVSKGVKEILSCLQDDVKVIHAGIKAFCKQQSTAAEKQIRFYHDILPWAVPFVEQKKIEIQLEDLLIALRVEFPFFEQFSAGVCQQLKELQPGGLIFYFDPKKSQQPVPYIESVLYFSIWRSQKSLNLLLNPREKKSIQFRLLGHHDALENQTKGLQSQKVEKVEVVEK